MEWLDSNAGSARGSLEPTPEILDSIGGNLSTHILAGMTNNFMDEFGFASTPLVGAGVVGVELASGGDSIQDRGLQGIAPHVGNYFGADSARLAVEYSGDRSLASVHITTALLPAKLLQFDLATTVHLVRIRPDKSFVAFDFASGAPKV